MSARRFSKKFAAARHGRTWEWSAELHIEDTFIRIQRLKTLAIERIQQLKTLAIEDAGH
jgi:hypothetical protein